MKHVTGLTRILAIKYIFDWRKQTADNVVKLIMNYRSTNNIATEIIAYKATRRHNQEYRELCEWNEINSNENGNETETNQMTVDNHSIMNRRYHNPAKFIEIFKQSTINNIIDRPFWTVIEGMNISTMMEITGDHLLQITRVKHTIYSNSYFNSMSAIWGLINDDRARNRRIVLSNDNSIAQALMNLKNHDWRIISIRETMSNREWDLQLINLEEMTQLKQFSDNYNMIPLTITTEQPYAVDYLQRSQIRKLLSDKHETEVKSWMNDIMNSITKNPTNWQNIPLNKLNTNDMMMLSNRIRTGEKRYETETIIPNNGYTGCQSEICSINDKNTLEHRTSECPRFSDMRNRLKEEINQRIRQLNSFNEEEAIQRREPTIVENYLDIIKFFTFCNDMRN